jgi:hypothetical protein
MAVRQHVFSSQHGLRDESVLSYMCQKDQCFDFGIRRRRIIQTIDVEAEVLSPNNCKYHIIYIRTGPAMFSGKLEFVKILLERLP